MPVASHTQSVVAPSAWWARTTATGALAGRCEGAGTPGLVLGASSAELTERQRQIARLAVAGLSSRSIAEQLSVSVRTVDNHLLQVYGKLGISGRDQLALDPAT